MGKHELPDNIVRGDFFGAVDDPLAWLKQELSQLFPGVGITKEMLEKISNLKGLGKKTKDAFLELREESLEE